MLSIRVAFLLPCRSIYIKRVKAGARNELELNVEFGATINLPPEKAGNGKEGVGGGASGGVSRVGFVSCHLSKATGFLRAAY